jgi:HD-GYP domain-containing protein (c-di-GMP phosphodiesterase class II)/HAMP domain-containing protein
MQTRRSYSLHVHLWLLFGGLVLAVGALICSINFVMTRTALEAATAESTLQISGETLDEVEGLVVPAQMAVKMLSHSSLADARSLDQRLARLALVCDALASSPVLQSLYLGYDDGSFFYVRPLRNESERLNFHAPQQASYVIRSLERSNGAMQGRHYFVDHNLKTIGVAEAADIAAGFDPRQRPWYATAMAAGSHVRTEPYMLFSERVAGATLAIPTANQRAVVGGDIRLDSLGNMLARKETVAGSVLALLDASGQVIAIDRKLPESARTDLLPSVSDYGIPVLTRLVGEIRASGHVLTRQGVMSVGGKEWYTTVDPLAPGGGKPLFLVSAIPEDELLRGARQRAWTGMGATGIVILLAIPLIWLAARYLSKPLHALADGVETISRFDFRHPVAVRSSIREINALGVATEAMRQTIQRFLTIAKAVSGEARLDHLLPLLLRKTINAAGGNAGVLYLVDGNELVPTAAFDRNGADAAHAAQKTSFEQALPLLRAAAGVLDAQAGYLMPDEIREAGLETLACRQPCHAAAIPLANHQHALQGIILVLRDTPMEAAQLGFVSTLASLFAGALEVLELTKAQRDLFDAFIQLLAGAIDAKSPHTGGHCERVPELAKMLAKAACDATDGPYESFQMTDSQWEALHVAAWLHDCGKVTTPEFIIDKATKLETTYNRIHEIRMRFEVLKRDAEIACLRSVAAGENDEVARNRRDAELKALDDDFAFVATCNQGGEFMDAGLKARLLRIAPRTWLRTLDDRLGISQDERVRRAGSPATVLPTLEPLLADKPEHVIARTEHATIPPDNAWGFKLNTPRHLYDRGELHNLLIERGTLSAEERFKIEDHIVQTQIMLSHLPFPKHLSEVPEIAGSHHEKMDGTGYPRRLSRQDMSPLARMMAIADVFEALTAADRPYKKAMTLSESVRIMSIAKAQHHIDPDLFDLFLTSGVYRRYAERYMSPEQIDTVDIAQYVGKAAADKQGRRTTSAE